MTKNEMPPRAPGRGAKGTGPRADKPAADKPVADKSSAEGPAGAAPGRQRVAKAMARAGLCSRRDAEAWVLAGRVCVNGELLASPARDIGPDDVVLIDGEPMPAAEKTRLFLFHKPRGLVTSDHDPEGRDTVAGFLRDNWPEGPRIVTIGRLDINTEGLLLLTNDGGLARVLELPDTGWLRRYRVRAKGETSQDALDGLAGGVTLEGMEYAGIEAKLDRQQGSNCWLTMGLREGKNREIKRVLEHLGLEVNRLIRLSFGPFQLGDLPDGAVEEVRTRVLRDQLGPALAAAAGVDLDEARPETNETSAGAISDRGGPDRIGRSKGRPRSTLKLDARGPRPTDSPVDVTANASTDPAAEPRRDRQPRTPGGPRRHVSALRAGADRMPGPRAGTGRGVHKGMSKAPGDAAEAPRTRIERTSTKDRHDRTVAVEHLVRHRPEPERSSHAKRPSPSAEAKRVRVALSGGNRRDDARPGGRRGAPAGGSRHDGAGERRDGVRRAGPRFDEAAGHLPGTRPGRGDEPIRQDRGSGDRPRRRSSGEAAKPDRAETAPRSRPAFVKPPGGTRAVGKPDGRGPDRRAPGPRFASRGDAAKDRSDGSTTGKSTGGKSKGSKFVAGKSAGGWAGRPATGRAAGPRAAGGEAASGRPKSGRSASSRPATGRSAGGRPPGRRSGPSTGKPPGGRGPRGPAPKR